MSVRLDSGEGSVAIGSAEKPSASSKIDQLLRSIEPLRVQSFALTGILLLFTIYALGYAGTFFVPVVLALLLSFLFASPIRYLSRLGVPAFVTGTAILAILLGTVVFSIYHLAAPAKDWMAKLPETAWQIERKLRGIKQSVQDVKKAAEEVERLTNLGDRNTPSVPTVETRASAWGETVLGSTQEFVVGAGFTFILLFFLLGSGDLFLRKLVSVLPRLQDRKRAVEISRQIEQDVSAYLLTITLINVCFGAAVGFCMYLMGLPNPFLWGVMAGFLHFVPFLGAIVGISVVTLVALVTLQDLQTIALVPISYVSLNLLGEYVVLPLVMGRRFALNPVVLLVWLIFWGWLWGLPGALMAVPLLAILKIVCDHIPRLAPLGEFLQP
jgi:predicted PurR-regulated permease PerM